jgi:hypothetical protein
MIQDPGTERAILERDDFEHSSRMIEYRSYSLQTHLLWSRWQALIAAVLDGPMLLFE